MYRLARSACAAADTCMIHSRPYTSAHGPGVGTSTIIRSPCYLAVDPGPTEMLRIAQEQFVFIVLFIQLCCIDLHRMQLHQL